MALIMHNSVSSSPIARLRKRGSLYLPAGEEGHNRLLLELFDHNYPVNETALFYRPSVQSYPLEVLEELRTPANRLERCRVVLKWYESGRIKFREILAREELFDTGGTEDRINEVSRQINYLLSLLERFDGYELILTDAFFPFHLTTFKIDLGEKPVYFTVFMQRAERRFEQAVHSFAVLDANVYQAVMNNIIESVIAHPTTTAERSAVIAELRLRSQQFVEGAEAGPP